MRSSPKTLTCTNVLLLFVALLSVSVSCKGQANIGALHIGAGTTWVSSPDTYVVLDRVDLQYDAGPGMLNNVFRFTGTGVNSIRGDSRPLIYAIGVAKTDPGALWLNQAVTIASRVNFETGYLNLNGYALYLQPAALFTNERENDQLVGNFGGYATIDADLHAGVTANPGNLGASITPATDLGKVTVFRGHQNRFLSPTQVGIDRWYYIVPSTGAPVDATLRFYYLDDEAVGYIPDSISLYQSASGTPWTDIGSTSRDAARHYIEKQGLTSLDSFTLALRSGSRILGETGDGRISLYAPDNYNVGQKLDFAQYAVEYEPAGGNYLWSTHTGQMEITKVSNGWVEGKFFFTSTVRGTDKKAEVTNGFFRVGVKGR